MKQLITNLSIISIILVPSAAISGEHCSNRNNQLAHLSGIQRVICEKALAAGYNLEEAGCINPNVAWFDRDNSMSEIDVSSNNRSVDSRIGRAMATIATRNGKTQAIQVCPGVYLATAHGVLDNPETAAEQNRDVRSPSDQRVYTLPYPLSRDSIMRATTDEQYISPVLRDPSKWSDRKSDYVFIKIDEGQALRPNDFVRPLNGTVAQFVEASEELKSIEANLYRGKTRFDLTDNNTPDNDRTSWKTSFEDLQEIYEKPLKVNSRCKLVSSNTGLISSDCPSESSVSGSPLITTVDNEPFLMGTVNSGFDGDFGFLTNNNGNNYVPSESFCSDYETACGQPCAQFDQVVPKKEQTVSL